MCRNDELPQFIKELDAAPNVCLDDPYDGPEQEYHRDPRGWIPGIQGIDSPECPDFIVTSHELLNLKVYWILEGSAVENEPADRLAVQRLARERLDRLNPVLDKYFPSTSPREPDERPEPECHRPPLTFCSASSAFSSPDCPDFIATRHELLNIAALWLMDVVFIDLIGFLEEPVGRRDRCVQRLAWERLDKLGGVLDKKERDLVKFAVEKEYRDRYQDNDIWRAFKATWARYLLP